MTQFTLLRHISLAAVVAGLSLGNGSAFAAAIFQDFQIDEGAYGGGIVTADKINGAYVERITFVGGTFEVSAYANFGQYLADEGTVNQATELNQRYGLYATLTATGSVSAVTPGITQFTGSAGDYALWLDPLIDNTYALPENAPGAPIIGNSSDDLLIGTASSSGLNQAVGILTAAGGFFDFIWDDFALHNPNGPVFFVDPPAFYTRMNLDGDFENFETVGNQVVSGDLSMVFNVPSPAPLALMSLSLLGLGYARRRKAG